MKKRAMYVLVVLIGLLATASCTKDYHCACTYNNTVVYNIDLGAQYKSNAQTTCTRYDSTIAGIPWQCTLY